MLTTPALVTVDGEGAVDVSGGAGLTFTVDPNFNSYDAVRLEVTVVVRRNGASNAGFNLKYEATDGWHGTGGWCAIPDAAGWQTMSWVNDDPQFVGKWGYHLALDSDSPTYSDYSLREIVVRKR